MIQKTRLALMVAAALATTACGSDTKEVPVEVPGPTIDNTKNSAPSISGVVTLATEGSEFSFMPSATDADDDALTFTATGLPAGLAVNAATGEVSGTPEAGSAGTHAVVVTVSDGADNTDMSFNLVVIGLQAKTNPDAPALTLSGAENEMLSVTLSGTDVDGDNVTVTLDDESLLPSWATYYADTGTISGTPGYRDAADDLVLAVTASDGTNDVVGTLTISVANTNQAPYVSSYRSCDTTNAVDDLTSLNKVCKSLSIYVNDRDGETPTVTNVAFTDSDGKPALAGWDYDGQNIIPTDEAFPLYDGEEYAAGADYTVTFDATDSDVTETLSFTLAVRQHSDSTDYDLDGIKNGLDATPEDGSDSSISIIGRGHENLTANIGYVDDIVEASIDSDPDTNTYTPTVTHLSSNDGGACVALSGYAAPVCQSAGLSAKTTSGASYSKAGLLDMAAAQADITELTVGDDHACWKADGEMTCSSFKGESVSTSKGVHTEYNDFVFYNNYSGGATNDLRASGKDTYCTMKSSNSWSPTSGGTSIVCDGEMSGTIDFPVDTMFAATIAPALSVLDDQVCHTYIGNLGAMSHSNNITCYDYINGTFVENDTKLSSGDDTPKDMSHAPVMFGNIAPMDVIDAEGHNICLAGKLSAAVYCNNSDLATPFDGADNYTFTELALGDAHVCALTSNDTVECWGDDTYGQVSDMPTLTNPTQITSSNDFSCALDDEGVKCWGAVENVSELSAGVGSK